MRNRICSSKRASASPVAYTIALVLSVLGTGGGRSVLTAQSNGAVPGTIQAYSTITSIGVEWDIVGDADHDATATAEARVCHAAVPERHRARSAVKAIVAEIAPPAFSAASRSGEALFAGIALDASDRSYQSQNRPVTVSVRCAESHSK
jgi:hypothetical protein